MNTLKSTNLKYLSYSFDLPETWTHLMVRAGKICVLHFAVLDIDSVF